MRGGIVNAETCFDFHDTAGKESTAPESYKNLARQIKPDEARIEGVEGAGRDCQRISRFSALNHGGNASQRGSSAFQKRLTSSMSTGFPSESLPNRKRCPSGSSTCISRVPHGMFVG